MTPPSLAGALATSPIVHIDATVTISDLDRPLRVASGPDLRRREHLLVRVVNAEGVEGYGEATPLTFFTGETAETARAVVEAYLGPRTLGQQPGDLGVLHRAWDQAIPHHRAAKCALDLALHDLFARSIGVPVATLLGGSMTRTLPVYAAIGIGQRDEVVNQVEALWNRGFRSVKLKVGDDPRQDLSNLAALRDRFGQDLEIIADGNGGYRPQDAVRFLRQAEPFALAYVEQPVPGDDVEGLAFVRAHGGVPVMADESIYTLADVYRLIKHRAVDLIGIKLIKSGGLYPAMGIARSASALGIGCVAISPFDSPVGAAATAQFASTLAPPVLAQGLGSALMMAARDDRSAVLDEGAWSVPEGPGFGVCPDPGLFGRTQP